MKEGSAGAVAKFLFRRGRRVPPGPLPIESPLETWRRPPATGLRATWLGHSTVLLEIDGVRVLTDPVWGPRASPFAWAGPKRFHEAPIPIAALPKLDAILVSHDHYDHLDYPTIRDLAPLGVPFVTSLGVGAHLEAWGIERRRIHELDWWEEVRVGDVAFTATPARHFSGRGLGSNQTLWSSWVIETANHRLFFSGDTGLTDEFSTIRARKGAFDLVMLEVGAFHPAWGDIHLGPDNALEVHRMLGAASFLPIHWGTFNLAIHDWDEPAEILAAKAPALGVNLLTPRLGRPIEPTLVERFDPWWREVAGSTAVAEVGTLHTRPG